VSRLLAATGARHGIVAAPQEVPRTFAEPASAVNVAVPAPAAPGWRSASGGIARTRANAEAAAVGEALERYAAQACALPRRRRDEIDGVETLDLESFSLHSPEQRRSEGFPPPAVYEGERWYVSAFDVADNREVRVPYELVGLSALATSSGLAAGPAPLDALTRAVQELVERDALMVTWLHGVPARRVELPAESLHEVAALGGEVACFDATPAYSPHPVALVAGQLPLRGEPRYSLGAACRSTWAAAVEKAYLEWLQGVAFVGWYRDAHPELAFASPRDVRTFEDHAVYYSVRPDEWARLPLLRGRPAPAPPDRDASPSDLVAALRGAGIRILYRQLTTVDVRAAGVHVVRALSPDLAPIHCDERWPFLGGTVPDVRLRYPWADGRELAFPSPYPHPLG